MLYYVYIYIYIFIGWLDVRTQKKIELLHSGQVATTRLLEFIDPDQLPIRYGGTATPDVYDPPAVAHPNCDYISIPYNSQVWLLVLFIELRYMLCFL